VDAAVAAARAAYPSWSQLSGSARARHLYSLARHVQKHARLLAVLEASNKQLFIYYLYKETAHCKFIHEIVRLKP
jgi:acyl-CoA reductase-like NAD-dependent aldehyde dehydrogenase